MGLPIIGAIAEVQNMPGFRAAIKEVNSSLQSVGQGMQAMSGDMEEGVSKGSILAGVGMSAMAAAAAAAVAAILALGAGLAAVTAHGISTNATLEKVSIQLEGLTGLGQENLEWAKELSVTRPFTPESVANALQMAYAYGFQGEQAKELVKVTGDVSAAFGDQGERMHRIIIALGQMHGAQKINAQDMRQLTEAGVDAWKILADAVGVSVGEVRQQVTDGMVAADFAVQAFTEAMGEKFGGAAERASDSLNGVIGNINNIIDLASAEISAPLFEALRDTLIEIRDVMRGPEFEAAVSDFADLMVDLMSGFDPGAIVGAFRDIIDAASDTIQFIREVDAGMRGLSGSDILARAADQMDANTARMQDSLNRLATSYADTVSSLNGQIEDASEMASSKMGDIAQKYADRTASINERLGQSAADYANRVDDLNRELERKLEDQQRGHDERLVSLAERHADRRASIEQSIADKIEDFNFKLEDMQIDLGDRITDIQERNAEKREDLEKQLAEATTDTQRASVQAQLDELDAAEQKEIAKLQAKSAREEERLKRDHDRAIEALQRKAAAEDAEYAKEVVKEDERSAQERARIDEDNAYALEQLARRHAQESGQISAQMSKLDAQRKEEEAAVQESYDSQVAALKKRLEDEAKAYEDQRAAIVARTEEHNARIEQMAKESSDSVLRSWLTVLSKIAQAAALIATSTLGDVFGAVGLNNLSDQINRFVEGAAIAYGSQQPTATATPGTQMTPVVVNPQSPNVVVQGGNTTVDRRVNINANYAKTQDPSGIREDLRLAAMLQR